MPRLLFDCIPKIVFEPVAIGMYLGIPIALFHYKRCNKFLFFSTTFSLLIICIWRIIFQSVIVSSRYVSIMIYPAILLSVYFISQIPKILDNFIRIRTDGKRNLVPCLNILAILAIAYLLVASLAKTLKYDPYADHTVQLSKTLSTLTDGIDVQLFTSTEPDRIAYYSGIALPKIINVGDKDNAFFYDFLKTNLKHNINCFQQIYYIFLKKDSDITTAEQLGINSRDGQWICLYKEYTSKRKNKAIVLYRFTPHHPNISVVDISKSDPAPAAPENNLCVNGDFEQVLSGNQLEERISYYRQINASDFYTTPQGLFPTSWWLGVADKSNYSSIPPQISLNSTNPLSGSYSLEMITYNNDSIGMNCNFIPKQDGCFYGLIKPLKGSTVIINPCYRDTPKNTTEYIDELYFYLRPERIYKFRIPIYAKDIPQKDEHIFLIIRTIGHVLLDNIAFSNSASIE